MLRPIKPLYDLLRVLFVNNASLDTWLKTSNYPKIQDFLDALPDQLAPREQYLVAVAQQMQAHKLDDESLFARLKADRPGQREEIESAQKDYLVGGDIGKQVDIVVAGLNETKQVMDANVKEALANSETSLTKLADGADTLNIYKNLHECLHQLQKISLRRLAVAAANLNGGPAQPGVLNTYRDKLATALTKATTFKKDRKAGDREP
jgi:hypothetical protein